MADYFDLAERLLSLEKATGAGRNALSDLRSEMATLAIEINAIKPVLGERLKEENIEVAIRFTRLSEEGRRSAQRWPNQVLPRDC